MINLAELKRMIYINDHPYVPGKHNIRHSRRENIPELRAKIAYLRDVKKMKFKDIAKVMKDGFKEVTAHQYYTQYKEALK